MSVSNNLISDMRAVLRINHEMYDDEISALIEAAKTDLRIGGISPSKTEDEADALIKRAITTYVKAEFGLDNADAEKYRAAYQAIRTRLMLSSEYREG